MQAITASPEVTIETNPHSFTNSIPGRGIPTPRISAHDDVHSRPADRIFIGPMPVATAEKSLNMDGKLSDGSPKSWWVRRRNRATNGQEGDLQDEGEVPEAHIIRYFLHRGGREEDWGSQESLRNRIRAEVKYKLRQSGWAPLGERNQDVTSPRKWVGKTFKIGDDFLGIPVETDMDVARPNSVDMPSQVKSSTSELQMSASRAISTQTYHTAPEQSGDEHSSMNGLSHGPNNPDANSSSSEALLISPSSPRRNSTLPRLLSSPKLTRKVVTDTSLHRASSYAAYAHPQISTVDGSTSPTIPLRSALHQLREDGRSKSVQFSPIPQSQVKPVPPMEVLARRSSNVPNTSAAATVSQPADDGNVRNDDVKYGDVIRRARMLVRRSNVKSGNVGLHFGEVEARALRDLHSYEWKEFLVIWRKHQLELYEDYSIPGKEILLGHKHLACVIPLQKPETRVSLYSFVDLTFCLTCSMLHVPKDKARTASSLSSLTSKIHFHRTSGTDVFVFKAKSRTTGIDWIWDIWRELGNEIPTSFEVHCPALDTRIKLRIPEYDANGGEGYKVFTKSHVLDLCRKALVELPSWDYLIEEPVRKGASLELCWRKDSMLDWVRWETDINGMKRSWAVLYGFCLERPREITHLEIRIGEHRPTKLVLSDGTRLQEPPSIEGYLYRIKPQSQNRTQVYISTHGGCLFSVNPNCAHPPRPPIPLPFDVSSPESRDDTDMSNFEEQGLQRESQQVLQANTFIDLHSVMAVRRAFQPTVPHQERILFNAESNTRVQSPTPQAEHHQDEEDEGGDEILAKHHNKPRLRMRRSFELLMKTGQVVRFETHSCTVAREWVDHLSRLVEYWKYRHRLDASQEMELIHAITGNAGPISKLPREQTMPERPPNFDEASEYLPRFWHWCVLDGCLPVVRNGRLFVRRGLRGQFKLMQLVLVSGHLIQFRITPSTSHYVRSRTISLLDAYVCSGHYGTQSLPTEEFSAAQDPLPRRFQDGLENEDHELDTVFLIWYRPHPFGKTFSGVSTPIIPPLKAKNRVLVLKARSKLERDTWCWVLNAEIEKLARRTRDREAKAVDGGLIKL